MRTALLCGLILVSSAVAAPVPKALKVSDTDRLQGRWECVSDDGGAGPQPNDSSWIEVVGDRLNFGSTKAPGYTTHPFKLDQTASLKRIDLERAAGEFAPGIYHLDGDTLTWCRTFESSDPRPKELKGGDHCVCYVFKRAKDK